MKLITEITENIEFFTELKESGSKDCYIRGIFLQSNIKNKNGRIYPSETMDNEVSRYVTEVIKSNRAYGELGHPSGPQINLDRVSHIITKLEKDGNNYLGEAKITNTPMGNIVRGLLESGGVIGVSSRGLGTLKPKDGIMEVQNDFRLATAADIVSDPSAPDAFVQGVMENVEWVYDPVKNSWFSQKLDDIKESIHKMSKSQLEQSKLSIFENYINSLVKNKQL